MRNITLVVLLAILPGSIVVSSARAASWRDVNDRQLAPWPRLQSLDGKFAYLTFEGTDSAYGEAVLGYALVMKANRTGDRAALKTGVRALTYAVRTANDPKASVFEGVAIPASYNLLRREQPKRFASVKKEWAAWIRRVRTLRIQRFELLSNKAVVEAVAILELLRTGVRSSDPKAIVNRPDASRKLAIRLLLERVPNVRNQGALVMSDRIDFPLAYHALSMAYYARAAYLLGRRGPAVIRRTVRRLAEASLLATAPDGEPAYTGRSQDQVWSLTGTVYGLRQAARYAPEKKSGALLAAADRVVGRLERLYPVASVGQMMVPAMTGQPYEVYRPALDIYANGVAYPGLAAMFLGWAVENAPNLELPTRAVMPADAPGFSAEISHENGRFAVVRRGDVWFTVKGKRAGRSQWTADYRYDFGLSVAKRLQDGDWRDIVPIRPRTTGTAPVSAGPVVQVRGRTGYPGGRVGIHADGTVEVRGGYYDAGGVRLRPAVFRFQPRGGCVVFTTDLAAGERYDLGAFFAGAPRQEGMAIRDGRSELRLNQPFSLGLTGPYASALEPSLTLATAILEPRTGGPLEATYC